MKFLSVSEDSWDQQKVTGGKRKSNTEMHHDFCLIPDVIRTYEIN